MSLFTIEWLQALFPNYQGKIAAHLKINNINTDSRKEMENALFIPLIGDQFNGHDYIGDAIAKGAAAVIWDEDEVLPEIVPEDFPVFFTKDTTIGLQKIAKKYRDDVNPTVIGITGSNGKTTTKDLIASVMKTTFRTHYTEGNLNNHIGLPLTILTMPRDTEVLVLEMGMSGFGEIDVLTRIARPDYAVITNIGESHIEFVRSREGIAKAKMEIQNGLNETSLLVIDGDEVLLQALHNKENVVTCGFDTHNIKKIETTAISVKGTSFKLADQSTYHVPLYGKHHARNATFAITIGEKIGITNENIQLGLQQLTYTSMRFELIESKQGYTIVNDAYNASPTSMIGAIDVLKQMGGFHKKILVLGDIFELGEFAADMHRKVATAIEQPITHLYTTGDNAKIMTNEVIKAHPEIDALHVESKEILLHHLAEHQEKGTIILFKASRGMAFETMVNRLISNDEA